MTESQLKSPKGTEFIAPLADDFGLSVHAFGATSRDSQLKGISSVLVLPELEFWDFKVS
jgi:hypothetical protein